MLWEIKIRKFLLRERKKRREEEEKKRPVEKKSNWLRISSKKKFTYEILDPILRTIIHYCYFERITNYPKLTLNPIKRISPANVEEPLFPSNYNNTSLNEVQSERCERGGGGREIGKILKARSRCVASEDSHTRERWFSLNHVHTCACAWKYYYPYTIPTLPTLSLPPCRNKESIELEIHTYIYKQLHTLRKRGD